MKPCRPPNSPLASAKPSCNSPRRVRKRSNNYDCYSEKQVDRASGKAFALPGYGGLRRSGRTSVQDSLRLKNRLFFFRAEKLALYQQIDRRSRARTDPFRLHGSANGYASMETYLLFALYLLRSIGSLGQFWRDRARAMNELAGLETFVSVLFSCSQVCIPSSKTIQYCLYSTALTTYH